MKRSLIALALAAVLPFSAQASDLSYSYIEGNYADYDNDANGFGVRGSIEFGDSNFYGFGGYQWLETDIGSLDFDVSEFGLGYAHGVSDNADLIAELAYANLDTDFGDADGYRASVGLRGELADNFEGLVKANYRDYDGGSDDFSGTLGAQFKFNPTWGLTGEVEFADETSYLVGVRASF